MAIEPIAAFWEQLGAGIRGGLAGKQRLREIEARKTERKGAEERQFGRQLELLGIKQEFATGEREAREAHALEAMGLKKQGLREMGELIGPRILGEAPKAPPAPTEVSQGALELATRRGEEAATEYERGAVSKARRASGVPEIMAGLAEPIMPLGHAGFMETLRQGPLQKLRAAQARKKQAYSKWQLETATYEQKTEAVTRLTEEGFSPSEIQVALGGAPRPAPKAKRPKEAEEYFGAKSLEEVDRLLADPQILQAYADRFMGGNLEALVAIAFSGKENK